MKHLCLIKWRSNCLIPKLAKIFEIRREESNVETDVLWVFFLFVFSLYVKILVNLWVGITKKITRKWLHSDSRFFQCEKLKDWKFICRISKAHPSETSIFHIVSTHVESWCSLFLCLSTNDIKEYDYHFIYNKFISDITWHRKVYR